MGSSDDSGQTPRALVPKPPVLPPKGGTLDDGPPAVSDEDIPFSPTLTPPPGASPGEDDLLELPAIDPRRYAVEGVVGRGGLGVILKARDRVLDRTVAIKRGQRRDDVATTRFVREALVTARLQHPSIVPVYDAGRWTVDEADPFYAMKLVDGKPLSQKVTKTTTLEERMGLLPNVIAVADALAYAHGERIIHRDLKPDNVLIGEFGETVVIDWGLAKDLTVSDTDERVATSYQVVAQGLTVDGAIMGTPEYMAPEQARGEAVDERADVYALGGLLYFVLVGEAPFRGTSKDEILAHIMEEQLDPLEQRHPHIPHDLAVIVTKAMQRDPENRYRTAKEMAEDLRRFQTGQLVSARSYTPWELVKRWAAKNRRLLVLSSVFVALTIAIAIYAFVNVVERKNEAQVARATAEQKTAETLEQTAEATRRRNELLLTNARSNLESDPTTTLAYLKQYPPEAPDWARVQELVIAAQERGVARHVLRHDNAGRLALSGDGRVLATGGDDKEIVLWDTVKGTELTRIKNANGLLLRPQPMTIARDGSALAYVDGHNDVFVAALPAGPTRKTFHADGAEMIAMSPDGRFVATIGTGLQIYDRRTSTLVERVDHSFVMAFAPDGRLATGGSEAPYEVRTWDPSTGAVLKTFVVKEEIELVAFSADGTQLAAAGTSNLVFASGATSRFLPAIGPPDSMAISADGSELITLHPHHVCVWASTGGDPKRTILINPHLASPNNGFSADGRVLVFNTTEGIEELDLRRDTILRLGGVKDSPSIAASADGTTVVAFGTNVPIRIWKRDRAATWTIRHPEGEVTGLAFSRDDKLLVSSSSSHTLAWTSLPEGRSQIIPTADSIRDLRFSPDDRWVIGTKWKHGLDLWNVETHKPLSLEHPSGTAPMPVPRFSSDGKTLYSAAVDGARIWNLATKTARLLPHPNTLSVDLSSDGRSLVTGDVDGRVMVWDIAAGTARELGHHRGAVDRTYFLPDNRVVTFSAGSGDTDRAVELWKLDGTHTRLFQGDAALTAKALSPDGRWVAVGGKRDGSISVFDLKSGATRTLSGHSKPVATLEFSPDSALLASGGNDNTLRLWRFADSAEQILHRHDSPISVIVFSHDGTQIASGANGVAWVGPIALDRFIVSDTRALLGRIDDLTTAVIDQGPAR